MGPEAFINKVANNNCHAHNVSNPEVRAGPAVKDGLDEFDYFCKNTSYQDTKELTKAVSSRERKGQLCKR